MTIKSLTITEDAYNALKTMKYGDESFSQAILRVSSGKKGLAAKFFGALKNIDATEWEKRIKARRAEIDKECHEREKRFKLIANNKNAKKQ